MFEEETKPKPAQECGKLPKRRAISDVHGARTQKTVIFGVSIARKYCRVLPGNATNKSWVLDLTFDLLDSRQAELQLLITLLILL
jgi:hypothetical protein